MHLMENRVEKRGREGSLEQTSSRLREQSGNELTEVADVPHPLLDSLPLGTRWRGHFSFPQELLDESQRGKALAERSDI